MMGNSGSKSIPFKGGNRTPEKTQEQLEKERQDMARRFKEAELLDKKQPSCGGGGGGGSSSGQYPAGQGGK